MMNELAEKIILGLKENGRFVIPFLGTFILKPARKGVFENKHGRGTPKYKWRVVFRPSEFFKKMLNKIIK